MAMDLAVQTFSTKPDYLIAGTDIRITTAVKEAGAALTRGMVVCLADGKLTQPLPAALTPIPLPLPACTALWLTMPPTAKIPLCI